MTAAPAAEPVRLRVSVTDRCDLRCLYCMPPEGPPREPRVRPLTFREIARFARVVQEGFDLRSVRLTGGEPLLRSGLSDLVAALAGSGLPDLSLTTNGQRLAPLAGLLKGAGLRRVNVSLDSVCPETYRHVTRGGDVGRVLAGLREAVRVGLAPVKTNTVVLRGVNDGETVEIARVGLALGCHVRFLELMPIGCGRPDHPGRRVSSAEVRARLEEAFALTPCAAEPESSSRDFAAVERASGLRGTIGLIASESAPFCAGCRRVRLTSNGELLGCLADDRGVNVRPLLRGGSGENAAALRAAVTDALRGKRVRASFATSRTMFAVGG